MWQEQVAGGQGGSMEAYYDNLYLSGFISPLLTRDSQYQQDR